MAIREDPWFDHVDKGLVVPFIRARAGAVRFHDWYRARPNNATPIPADWEKRCQHFPEETGGEKTLCTTQHALTAWLGNSK